MLRLTDLREILRYVPRFREKTFIISMDGAVVAEENFGNLLLDIALLRSLRIGVILVHGASHQIRRLAEQTGQKPSNLDGTGITDQPTLQLAMTAANRVTHEIMVGLSANDLRCASSNSLVAHPAGILQGIDHQWTGRVERVDADLLQALMGQDIIPVIGPLGCDGEGNTFRLNSDAVAVDVALALHAVKLIYLTGGESVLLEGQLVRQLTVEEVENILKKHRDSLPVSSQSKLQQAIRGARNGIPRIHIIDGRVEEGLLAEVFSNEGVGTLVHANEYQAIRRAQKKDARAIYSLVKPGMETEELLQRSLRDIERQLDDFFLFEIDRHPVGCVALHFYQLEGKAELAALSVHPQYENQGIGRRLMEYVEAQARAGGARQLFCLSTQAFNYFLQKGNFRQGTPADLPAARFELYERTGRCSQVLVKDL